MHLLKFISYTNNLSVDGIFKTESRAMEIYRLAVAARDEGLKAWVPDSAGVAPFDFIDDYGVHCSVNLFQHAIVLTNTDASARMQIDLDVANKAALAKHGKPAVGFGTPKPGLPIV